MRHVDASAYPSCMRIISISGRFTRSFYHNDPELIYAHYSFLEALTTAKQQGKVRFVGFNGPQAPRRSIWRLLNLGYAFDVVQMPLQSTGPGLPQL